MAGLRILPALDVSPRRPVSSHLRILPAPEPPLIERVVARLVEREGEERDPWLRDDLRQARLTVHYAGEGSPIPFILASYELYGSHPEKVWENITAERKAKLGQEYGRCFDAAGNLKPQFLDIPDYDPLSDLSPCSSNQQIDVYLKKKWPKGPLRRVVSRIEVLKDKGVAYHREELECGHLHIEFLDANPGNRRRRCNLCRGLGSEGKLTSWSVTAAV